MKDKIASILFILAVAATTVFSADNFIRGIKFDGESGLKTGAQLEDLVTKSLFTTNAFDTGNTNRLFDGTTIVADTTTTNIRAKVNPDLELDSLIVNDITMTPQKSTSITWTNTMTWAEMQETIDDLSKYIPGNQKVTINVGLGNANISTNKLQFRDFYGKGTILVQGDNYVANTLATNWATIDFSTMDIGSQEYGIQFIACDTRNQLKGLRLVATNGSDIGNAVVRYDVTDGGGLIESCFIQITGGTNEIAGVRIDQGLLEVSATYFEGGQYGIWADNVSTVAAGTVTNITSQPSWGVYASEGGQVGVRSDVYITGVIADELEATGGQVFP